MNKSETKSKTIKGFEIVDIEGCSICKTKNTTGVCEGVTRDVGISSSHSREKFCEKCFKENTFKNSLGFTFLKIEEDLFCYKPYYYLDFGFREVLSECDIDRAFNPEKYEFEKWLNN